MKRRVDMRMDDHLHWCNVVECSEHDDKPKEGIDDFDWKFCRRQFLVMSSTVIFCLSCKATRRIYLPAAVNKSGKRDTCPATASGLNAARYLRSLTASRLNFYVREEHCQPAVATMLCCEALVCADDGS